MNRRNFSQTVLGLRGATLLPGCTSLASRGTAPANVTGVGTHAHVFHRGLPCVANRRYTPAYDALPEQFVSMLDANGLSHGI